MTVAAIQDSLDRLCFFSDSVIHLSRLKLVAGQTKAGKRTRAKMEGGGRG